MGPKQALLMVDGRAERKKDQVCSPVQYDKMFARMEAVMPDSVDHLIVQLGVPIAYPRMVFLVRANNGLLLKYIHYFLTGNRIGVAICSKSWSERVRLCEQV